MAVKLKQLTGDASDSRAASFALQHTLAAGALASFLSYLCFAAGGSGGQSDGQCADPTRMLMPSPASIKIEPLSPSLPEIKILNGNANICLMLILTMIQISSRCSIF